MRKRKKPYLLIGVVVMMLSIVGYVNLKSAFAGGADMGQQQPGGDAPPALETGTEQKEDMKQSLMQTMAPTSKVRVNKEGDGGVRTPDRPMVENPGGPPMKPVPSESQTGRLSDSPEARH